VQYTPERHPELPDVPALIELGRTAADKQVLALYGSTAIIGRSFTTAPDVPADKIFMLRSAFDAMVRDVAFLNEIEKGKLEFEPMSGIELQAIIADVRNVSEVVKERARRARGF
jgi:tripartite-type tricarboxylate transporter receptor subunit TctC